jgi:hypothetical protein
VGSSVIKLSSLKDLRISKGLVFILLAAFCAGAYFLSHKPSPCQGPWNSPEEMMACKFPNPPIGRWKAVYSAEFAKEHNLPPENISSDLSPGVDYMEMDVQPYAENGVACLVNMLIKRPNDVALFNLNGDEYIWASNLNNSRQLLHFEKRNTKNTKLQKITSFSFASRNYGQNKGFRRSTFAFYTEDASHGYDYVTANAHCQEILKAQELFPDGFSFWVNKASVWGKHETPFQSYNNPNTPKGEYFFQSHFHINIPGQLISIVFEGMPIGGR